MFTLWEGSQDVCSANKKERKRGAGKKKLSLFRIVRGEKGLKPQKCGTGGRKTPLAHALRVKAREVTLDTNKGKRKEALKTEWKKVTLIAGESTSNPEGGEESTRTICRKGKNLAAHRI